MLESRVYDAVKNYSLRILRTASVPFAYQTVTGDTFVVENSAIRKMAINYMDSAMRLWGYYRGTIAIETPTVTPVYTPVVTRPVIPEPTPVYTLPVIPEPTPVYTLPVIPEPTPVYIPPVKLPVIPEVIPAAYATQESYKLLAKHALELSLRANADILAQVNIRDPLTPPLRPTELPYTIYDFIKEYAKATMRTAVIPFGYETVRGERFMVRSSGIRSSALKYMEKAIRLWGYHRSAVTPEPTPEITDPTPVYVPPALRTPVYRPPIFPETLPIIPEPLPRILPEPPVLELPVIPEATPVYTPRIIPELPPVYTPRVELPITPEVIMVEEGKAVQWAVSYTLSEAGYPQYASSSETRTGVSQEVFNSLVNRAGYIADQMIQQNTYSPRL
jgi:hypothetical protein